MINTILKKISTYKKKIKHVITGFIRKLANIEHLILKIVGIDDNLFDRYLKDRYIKILKT